MVASRRKSSARPLPASAYAAEATLLLADPDRQACAALRQQLETDGYQVLVVHSGRQAIKLVYERHPHLAILDARLPDLNGHSICQQIKSDETLGFLPVILTASPPDGDEPSADEADATLAKPVVLEELNAWLRYLLRMKRQIDHLILENQRLAIAARDIGVLKSEIISNVSHELATPLVQVKSAVALLVDDLQAGTTPEITVAEMAVKAVARLESVVENIRQLAQAHDIHLSPVAVSDAVDLAIRHLERSWASREARDRVAKRLERDLPLVLGDKRAMGRLLQLMIDNALKFSPAPKPVHVVASRAPEGQVWIGVQDFGIGIAPEEHARIFDAFYQVDGSSTKRYGGTGNGLALAMLLAQAMGTSIHLESEPGRGSTFWFLLPEIDPDDYDTF